MENECCLKTDQDDSKVTFIYLNDFKVTFHMPQVTSKLPKNRPFSAGFSSFSESSGHPWPFKILRKNEYNLFMDSFGSDQSRHVDDFGAKTRNVNGILATKSHFQWPDDENLWFWCSLIPRSLHKIIEIYLENVCFLKTHQDDSKVTFIYLNDFKVTFHMPQVTKSPFLG